MSEPDHARKQPSSNRSGAPRSPAGSALWAGLEARLQPQRSMSDGVVARLSRDIHAGALRPGDRLPTEQQLGAALGVSRTVVREAVAALRADGLVIARQGSGMFVATPDASRPFRIDPAALENLIDVLSLMELRTGVESEAAALAALRRTPDDLVAIDAAMAAFDVARRGGGDPAEADGGFHHAVALATHNTYFADFGRYLGQFLPPRPSVRIMAVPPADRAAHLRRVAAEHRLIRDAVAAGDGDKARAAAQRHLRLSRARYGKLRDRLTNGTG